MTNIDAVIIGMPIGIFITVIVANIFISRINNKLPHLCSNCIHHDRHNHHDVCHTGYTITPINKIPVYEDCLKKNASNDCKNFKYSDSSDW